MQSVRELYRKCYYGLIDFLISQQDRLPLWLPVVFGTGIGIYFSLSFEPLFIPTTLLIFIIGAFLLWDGWKKPETRLLGLFVFMMTFGFFTAQVRTFAVSTEQLKSRTRLVHVTGTVEEITDLADKRVRVVLNDVHMEGYESWSTPYKIRLSLKKDTPVPNKGDIITAESLLSPPSMPLSMYGYDSARALYFQKIGAIGYTRKALEIQPKHQKISLRQKIGQRISSLLPEDTAEIAKALVIGEAKAIPPEIAQNYRESGIAHILSVSGLHMSLIAGFIFALVRSVLSLIPAIALRYSTKKIAAVISLLTAFCYLFLSGASLPAQRSFIMLALALTAVMLNRRALSVVSVAWAAFFILLAFPETIVSASFALSFSAVIALITAYESNIDKYNRLLAKKEGVMFYLLSAVAGILLTALIAGIATAPFTIYHFKQIAVYTLLGNLLSSAVTGFWVMPSLLAGTILIPLGLDKPFFLLASYGIKLINAGAAFTASLPHSVYHSPSMPTWGLLCAVFGGLWLCLWRGKIRFVGVAFFMFSIFTPYMTARPDMQVSLMIAGFRNPEGGLVLTAGKAESLTRSVWLSENGQTEELTTVCPDGFCVYEKGKVKVGYARTKKGARLACQRTDLDMLFISIAFDEECPVKHIGRSDLFSNGVYNIFISNDEIRLITSAEIQGFRPWSTPFPKTGFNRAWRHLIPYKNDYAPVKGRIVPLD